MNENEGNESDKLNNSMEWFLSRALLTEGKLLKELNYFDKMGVKSEHIKIIHDDYGYIICYYFSQRL